jgi:hypothetical protein
MSCTENHGKNPRQRAWGTGERLRISPTHLFTTKLPAAAFLLLLQLHLGMGGCIEKSDSKTCVGSCLWNFVGQCCYDKGKANCYNSLAYVNTKPSIDSTQTIGIPGPDGSSETATGSITQIPMENNPPPAIVPTPTMGMLNSNPGSIGQSQSPDTNGIFGPNIGKRLRR